MRMLFRIDLQGVAVFILLIGIGASQRDWCMVITCCVSGVLFLIPAGNIQFDNAANEFYIGFARNFDQSWPLFPILTLFVLTSETDSVDFTITANGFSYSGVATNNYTTQIDIPRSLEVLSSGITDRDKGIYVKAEGNRRIIVYGLSEVSTSFSSDAFLALPCIALAGVNEYEYYAVGHIPTDFPDDNIYHPSEMLIVACNDNTVVTTPTTSITLSRRQTYQITQDSMDLTGTRITSSKPVSVFSAVACAEVPIGRGLCDHLVEQVPPTLTWGTSFLVASLLGRNTGEDLRILSAQDGSTVIVNCTNLSNIDSFTLSNAGDWMEITIAPNSYCSIEASSPVFVVQYAYGGDGGLGDPFMMIISPVEQFSNNFVLHTPLQFPANYFTLYVTPEYFQPQSIFLDDSIVNEWLPVYCSDEEICGYISRVNVSSGLHRFYHEDFLAKIGVSAYGFDNFNSYGYPGSLTISPLQPVPIISLNVSGSPITAFEGSSVVVCFTVSEILNDSVLVTLSTTPTGDRGATEGEDYSNQLNTTILPGTTQSCISILIFDDGLFELPETFSIAIGTTTPALLDNSTAEITVVIEDNTIECLALPGLANGTIEYATDTEAPFEIGTVSTHSCEAGYALVGETTRTCVDDNQTGVWNGTSPSCEPIECLELPELANGTIGYATDTEAPFEIGTVSTHSCESGYVLVVETTRTCVDDNQGDTVGIWNGTAPNCKPIMCPALDDLGNGTIVYATDTMADFDLTTTATHSCVPSYALVGNAVRTCQDDNQSDTVGVWSGTIPSCDLIECPALPGLVNGTIEYSTDTEAPFEIGTESTHSCEASYSLAGETTRTCTCVDNQAGLWNGTTPSCEPIECPTLPGLANGTIEYITDTEAPFEIGTVGTHSCEVGYALVGEITRTCVDDNQSDTVGVWNGTTPSCETIECPALPELANGTIGYATDISVPYEIGTVSTHTCEAGFALVGETTRTCVDDNQGNIVGIWNGTAPNCKLIECPALPPLVNGTINYATDTEAPFEIGTVRTHTCEAGYALVGETTSTCVDDNQVGVWNGTIPGCEPIECLALPRLANGTIEYAADTAAPFEIGTLSTHSCEVGYALVGEITRTCVDDNQSDTVGVWNGTIPSCEPIECLALPRLANGTIEYAADTAAPFEIGTLSTHSCEVGYALVGEITRTCVDDNQSDTVGVWNGTTPSCEPIECPALPELANGTIGYATDISAPYEIGTVSTHTCEAGFALVGETTRTCVDDNQGNIVGIWNGTAPNCKLIECPALPPLVNGTINYATDTEAPFEIGTVRTHTCEAGYALVGETTSTCVDDNQSDTVGVWNGTIPSCEPIECLALPRLANGTIEYAADTAAPFEIGTLSTHSCEVGYALVGEITRTCVDDNQSDTVGVWNGTIPSCEPIECPTLPGLANGTIEYTTDTSVPFEIGTLSTHTCEVGYALVGETTRTCVDDNQGDIVGVWNGTAPNCEPIECPALPALSNGTIEYAIDTEAPFEINTVSKHICGAGFALAGETTRTCVNDNQAGLWNGTAPSCETIECPELPALANGIIEYNTDTVPPFENGTVSTHSCEAGYVLVGNTTRTCIDDNRTGDWNSIAPICKAIECPALPELANGAIQYYTDTETSFEIGTLSTHSCEAGFVLVGETARTCVGDNQIASGIWNGTAPSCEPNGCPELPSPANGAIEYIIDAEPPFEIGTLAIYMCEADFNLTGNMSRGCLENNHTSFWNGTAPTCERTVGLTQLQRNLIISVGGITLIFTVFIAIGAMYGLVRVVMQISSQSSESKLLKSF